MKFTLNWLKEHLETDADLKTITDKLTAIGHELEGVENPAEALKDFRVAEVTAAKPHPNADKLQLLTVDAGTDKPWQVVCGAPNARAGMKGVFAPPGAWVPGAGFELKAATIRGVESFGMMCSEKELEISDAHEGIIELPGDARTGMSYADYAGLDDPVIDVAITPNRQDCMGVRGIARDLAAAGLGTLKPLHTVYRMPGDGIAADGPGPDVRTDDPEGCPAFYARMVRGVTNGSAPAWMAQKLTAIGQKPISVLVDITNFVMIDLGRPLHVYDAARLSGPLVARKAKPGEQLVALNGKTYTLDDSMTVIADDSGVHDIGGIMGGEETGASDDTTDVLIECAWFAPETIARTGQKLALTSDARQRFERGVDPAFLDEGLAIATWLVTEHCGGTPSQITRAGSPPLDARTIAYDPARAETLGGIAVAPDRQRGILERLGFAVAGDGPFTVTVPSWRRDVEGSADLVEEVVRMVGLDALPSTPLPRAPGVAKPTASPEQKLERRLRRLAAARGLNEAVNWSFISAREAEPFGGGDWTVANPISEELKIMRPSLLPGLLSAAKRNMDRSADSVRLFEVGRRYFRGGDGNTDERATLTLLLAGERTPRDWQNGKAQGFGPFDAKADVLSLLDAAGVDTLKLMEMGFSDFGHGDHYHPGQSGTLRLGPKNVLAAYGTLHPAVTKAFGLKGAVMAAELFLDAIPLKARATHMREAYAPPAQQPVTRDFAFLIDAGKAAGDLVRAIRGADKKHIVAVRAFDRFDGAGVPEGKLSLAIEVMLQPGEQSFTEEELTAISDKVVAAAARQGGELRG